MYKEKSKKDVEEGLEKQEFIDKVNRFSLSSLYLYISSYIESFFEKVYNKKGITYLKDDGGRILSMEETLMVLKNGELIDNFEYKVLRKKLLELEKDKRKYLH